MLSVKRTLVANAFAVNRIIPQLSRMVNYGCWWDLERIH
jgi:hypothetical protein